MNLYRDTYAQINLKYLKNNIETTYKIMLGKDIKEIFVFIDFLKSKIDFKYLSQKIWYT